MQNYIFDLYNTLIDIHTDEHRQSTWTPVAEYFKAHGMKRVSEQSLCADYDKYWKLYLERAEADRQYVYPECDAVSIFESMARAAGGRLTRVQAAEALCIMRKASVVHKRLFDGTTELFEELRARGAKLYLLSNAQAAFTYAEIEECGLKDAFDGMLLSSECGVRKPDAAFFEMLFDKYGLDKASSVMVGDDTENDVRGAERFGIAAVWAGGGASAHAKELLDLAKGDEN
ncbi:MAG: HAD family hydrolase [Clostridiales bacterium]|nr:HAD family hydrolase [Clostridiales bacterium]